MNLLFLDTETTGLPSNWKAPVTGVENWPRCVDLGVIGMQVETGHTERTGTLIQPEGFEIPPEATAVHGISTEMALAEGRPAREVFEPLFETMVQADFIVGHNVGFDLKVMGAEFVRLGLEPKEWNKLCTMLGSRSLFGKWPKLEQLYEHLFKRKFEGAHRALTDITATQDAFVALVARGFFPEVKMPEQVWRLYLRSLTGAKPAEGGENVQ